MIKKPEIPEWIRILQAELEKKGIDWDSLEH